MTVDVYWLSRRPLVVQSHGPWDTGLLDAMFDGALWPHPWEFNHHHNVASLEVQDRAIVVLPARHHATDGDIDWLNAELRKLKAALLILVGDEEGIFPWRDIKQDNVRFWVQIPSVEAHMDMADWAYFFGDGWKRDTPALIGAERVAKSVKWSFAGQVTNARRIAAVKGLTLTQKRTPGELLETEGFTQGIAREHFLQQLKHTKVAPCPGGPHTPDTFRLYEALEAGCYPIVDSLASGYWQMVYGRELPFDVIDDWGIIGGLIESAVKLWPAPVNRAQSWWVRQKKEMVERLNRDLVGIGLTPDHPKAWDQLATIVVTCSPIKAHPDVSLLVETIESAWTSIGQKIPVVVAFDGVRKEQEPLRQAYEEAIEDICWRSQHGPWAGRVFPLVSQQHRHQAKMTRLALDHVRSPTILFMEHDTPFNEREIDWGKVIELVAYGGIDMLRFHHEAAILDVHAHLMEDEVTREMLGVPLRRTRQWSQRPHLARVDYYRRMLDGPWWGQPNNGFIEDTLHGIVQNWGTWGNNRIAIYHPDGSIQRTLHTDGRAGGPKFDDRKTM